jgi:hypothetical protein
MKELNVFDLCILRSALSCYLCSMGCPPESHSRATDLLKDIEILIGRKKEGEDAQ